MERFTRFFFSMKMMTLAMIIFFLAVGIATFIEASWGIQTAKIIIYNALWFEVLLVYLGINLIANIFKYDMYKREKIASLMFHLSFIIILIGAGVTRYISFEGIMRLPEPDEMTGVLRPVDYIYSADPHLYVKVNDGKLQTVRNDKMFMSEKVSNNFSYKIQFPGHKDIRVEYVAFESKRIDSLIINDSISGYVLDIVTDGMKSNYLGKDGFLMVGDVALSFDKKDAMPGVEIIEKNGNLMLRSQLPLSYLPMSEMQKARESGVDVSDSAFTHIPVDSLIPFRTTTLYKVQDQQFVYKGMITNARMMRMPSGRKDVGLDYLILRLKKGEKERIVTLAGGMNQLPIEEFFEWDGLVFQMQYGSTRIQLPFSLACNDFILDRYPGSNAPSSFESVVTVLDPERETPYTKKIFMNHVMDYKGYRFFQSSYFEDEKGTILSVNHDWWGTNITYFGYLLMAIGMIMSLFAPKGRFSELNQKLKKSRIKREALQKSLTISGLIALMSFTGFSQGEHVHNHDHHEHHKESETTQEKATEQAPPFFYVSSEHSEELATLLVQDVDGRIVPFHTLCDKLLRKVSRKNTFEGQNAIQTILSMHMFPEHWLKKKFIYVSPVLFDKLEIKEKYASILDLLNERGEFKLFADYEKAHKKLDKEKGEYDKQLIKLVERFQIVQNFPNWSYMRLIPLENADNNTWFIPIAEEVYSTDSTIFLRPWVISGNCLWQVTVRNIQARKNSSRKLRSTNGK